MILDGHIHIMKRIDEGCGDELKKRLEASGVSGGAVISYPPAANYTGEAFPWGERLKEVVDFAETDEKLYPMFWIDPMQDDAKDQVDAACKNCIDGFKIICDAFLVSDKKAMEIVRYIAAKGKPVLFHSGILWDGKVSSKFNRPIEFECLLEVEGLKFALAHVSWPWHDECIAMYGKILEANAHNKGLSAEMFIDLTPGTPPIYREEVLTKVLKTGYDVENNIIFGTDCFAGNYNSDWAEEWIKRDNSIYDKLETGEEVRSKIFGENLLRFLGKTENSISKRIPVPS